jgi:hypothetical protein
MFPRVIEASYVRDYIIRVRFLDGVEGEVDLQPQLYGEVFEPLKASAYFRQFRVDPELHTLTWPNGADFAPEFLYEKVQVPA